MRIRLVRLRSEVQPRTPCGWAPDSSMAWRGPKSFKLNQRPARASFANRSLTAHYVSSIGSNPANKSLHSLMLIKGVYSQASA